MGWLTDQLRDQELRNVLGWAEEMHNVAPACEQRAARNAILRFHQEHRWERRARSLMALILFGLPVTVILCAVTSLSSWTEWVVFMHLLACGLLVGLNLWKSCRLRGLVAEELATPSLRCATCGYDLQGASSEHCPECGTARGAA